MQSYSHLVGLPHTFCQPGSRFGEMPFLPFWTPRQTLEQYRDSCYYNYMIGIYIVETRYVVLPCIHDDTCWMGIQWIIVQECIERGDGYCKQHKNIIVKVIIQTLL